MFNYFGEKELPERGESHHRFNPLPELGDRIGGLCASLLDITEFSGV